MTYPSWVNTDRFKQLISKQFEMEDLGECKSFLGMRVSRNHTNRTITLTQDSYIRNILIEYGMEDCQPVTTPMVPNTHLVPASDEELAAFQSSGENY